MSYRPALHQRVWAEPIHRGPSLGFTNIRLVTARRTGVVVPSRDHWAEHQTPPSIGTRIAF